ncbi:MAG: lycopene cyclase domain-containing protein [Sporichthyaceae bacterium]
MSYTALAVVGVVGAVLLDLVVLRTRVVTRRAFWTAYAIIVGFQLLTNGWLTGRDIVRYDDGATLGVRLVYAPVEDLLFGFSLVVQTLSWWVYWGRRGVNRPVRDAP